MQQPKGSAFEVAARPYLEFMRRAAFLQIPMLQLATELRRDGVAAVKRYGVPWRDGRPIADSEIRINPTAGLSKDLVIVRFDGLPVHLSIPATHQPAFHISEEEVEYVYGEGDRRREEKYREYYAYADQTFLGSASVSRISAPPVPITLGPAAAPVARAVVQKAAEIAEGEPPHRGDSGSMGVASALLGEQTRGQEIRATRDRAAVYLRQFLDYFFALDTGTSADTLWQTALETAKAQINYELADVQSTLRELEKGRDKTGFPIPDAEVARQTAISTGAQRMLQQLAVAAPNSNPVLRARVTLLLDEWQRKKQPMGGPPGGAPRVEGLVAAAKAIGDHRGAPGVAPPGAEPAAAAPPPRASAINDRDLVDLWERAVKSIDPGKQYKTQSEADELRQSLIEGRGLPKNTRSDIVKFLQDNRYLARGGRKTRRTHVVRRGTARRRLQITRRHRVGGRKTRRPSFK